MPYPPPPEPPPIIRHPPQPQTTETGIIGLEAQISSRVKTQSTISYPLPEYEIEVPDPVSAELLGSTVTIETAQPLTDHQYRFDASFSFTDTDNSCQTPCNRIVVTPPKTPTQESTVIPVPTPADIVEITADRQEYDQQRQIVTAQGNVMVRFRQSLINAEQAQVNLNTRQVIAQGNVALTRGDQVIRGDRMDYNFVQSTGSVYQANGVVYTPSAATDLTVVDPLPQVLLPY
jgi:Organic solvent tolerance protein OstA